MALATNLRKTHTYSKVMLSIYNIQYRKERGKNTILNLAAIFTSLRKLDKLKVLVMQFQRNWIKFICACCHQVSTIVSVLLNVVPFFSLLVLNLIIYQTIKKKTLLLPHSSSRERRDLYVATILITIVMIFAGCHSIKTVINLVELLHVFQGDELWNNYRFIFLFSNVHFKTFPESNFGLLQIQFSSNLKGVIKNYGK